MKFSIITVTYNCEQTIEKTIVSVLNQENAEYEYLICDGMSCDNTVSIISRYSDRLSWFLSEPDTGIYNAMNKALYHAKGDAVIFLNSGDYFADSNALSRTAENFDDHTDILIAKELIEGKICKTYTSGVNKSVYIDAFFPHQATFSKLFLYKEDGFFDEKLSLCADYDWILREYSLNRRIKWVDDVVSVYDANGVSSSVKCIAEQYSISRKYLLLSNQNELISYLDDYYSDMFRKVFFRRIIKDCISNEQIIHSLDFIIGNRTVSVWGNGTIGKALCLFLLKNNYNIDRIIDESSIKHGTDFEGIKISNYYEKEDDLIIVGSEDYDGDICFELNRQQKIPRQDYYSYYDFSTFMIYDLLKHGYDDQNFSNSTGLDLLRHMYAKFD